MYGGQGIAPDVKVEEPKLSPIEQKLAQRGAFFNFGKYYFSVHATVPRDFTPDDAVLQEFKQFLIKQHLTVTDQNINENADFIEKHIRAQLIGVIYGEDEANKINTENDYLVQKALDHLGQAKELMADAKKYVASKNVN